MRAGTVTLRLRYTDFHTIARARTVTPTCVDTEVQKIVLELYRRARTRPLGVRLVGVALSKLSLGDGQIELPTFDAAEKRGRAVDAVRDKFGYDALHLASTVAARR